MTTTYIYHKQDGTTDYYFETDNPSFGLTYLFNTKTGTTAMYKKWLIKQWIKMNTQKMIPDELICLIKIPGVMTQFKLWCEVLERIMGGPDKGCQMIAGNSTIRDKFIKKHIKFNGHIKFK